MTGKSEKEESSPKWWVLFIVAPLVVGLGLWLVPKVAEFVTSTQHGLSVAASWPVAPTCDGFRGVAGIEDVPAEFDRSAIANSSGGGAWSDGLLLLTFSSDDGAAVSVLGVKPRVELVNTPATWAYAPDGGCGGDELDIFRSFVLDLDSQTFENVGEAATGESDPFGASFTVDASTPAIIAINAYACSASYDFWLDVTYSAPGDDEVSVKELGPYRVYADPVAAQSGTLDWYGDGKKFDLSWQCIALPN